MKRYVKLTTTLNSTTNYFKYYLLFVYRSDYVYCRYCRSTLIGRHYRSICRPSGGRPTIGPVSICRPILNRHSIDIRPIFDWHSTDTQPISFFWASIYRPIVLMIYRLTAGEVLASYRSTVGELSASYRWIIGELSRLDVKQVVAGG